MSKNNNDSNDVNSEGNIIKKARKAYDNKKFLHSRAGREIRILSEYSYPKEHFLQNAINRAIIFFGSARILSRETFDNHLVFLEEQLHKAKKNEQPKIIAEIETYRKREHMVQHYEDARELARLIAGWSNTLKKNKRFYICTGGGPGIMEAANKGAFEADAPNIGLNISLPFEQMPNQYISPNLNFEFHYFFMRKFWFVYLAQALIVFPGGFGTLDEMMEILTLKQTLKVTKPLPIYLYSKEYWSKVINFQYLVDCGMISKDDLDLFVFVDSPAKAFELIKTELVKHSNLEDQNLI
jgi:uncharacterized protein (TIGR00730 family)